MKRLLLYLSLTLIALSSASQTNEVIVKMKTKTTPFITNYNPEQLIRVADSVHLFALTHKVLAGQTMKMVFDSGWYKLVDQPSTAGADSVITAGAITSLPEIAYNPGSNISAAKWIQKTYYQTQIPLATLSGGVSQEIHSPGTFSATLSWSASRQAGTSPISSIVVAGSSQTFAQPDAPGTVSGTKIVTVVYNNSTTTFSNVVTTTDSKTASASTTFSFYSKRYWGRTSTPISYLYQSDPTVCNAVILAIAGGGSDNLGSTKVFATPGPRVLASGSNYIFIAYPATNGTLQSIKVGGFESINAFVRTTVNLTNASGYVQNYYVYCSVNSFSADTPEITTY
jgi:hypothetical protein